MSSSYNSEKRDAMYMKWNIFKLMRFLDQLFLEIQWVGFDNAKRADCCRVNSENNSHDCFNAMNSERNWLVM